MEELIKSIKIINIGSNDKVLINIKGRVNHESKKKFYDEMKKIFPNNKVLIADDSIDIEILREI